MGRTVAQLPKGPQIADCISLGVIAKSFPLETVQEALLMGAVRKYVSWLNGGSSSLIGSLAYFSALVSEIQERPLPAGYEEYLQRKVMQLGRAWSKQSSIKPQNGRYLTMSATEIVQ